MAYEFLGIEQIDTVSVVTLNRPDKRNALSHAVRLEIARCLGELAEDDGVSVVVLLTEGPVYCAGFDITEFSQLDRDNLREFNASSERYHNVLAEFPKPLVTGVQGPAMGGGFDLAVLCDMRIATPDATFAHPEIKFGAPVLLGPLKEIIGGGPARELALTGRSIDAETAQAFGLVTEIVQPHFLREACLHMAKTIAEAPLPALKTVKHQIIKSYGGRRVLGNGDGGAFPVPET